MAYPLHVKTHKDISYSQGRKKKTFASGRVCTMDISTFEIRLNELLNEINDLPTERSKKLLSLAKQAKMYNEKLQKSSETLHDSLDHLRLTVKYLLFDLEATRRENQYLRKMLEKGE